MRLRTLLPPLVVIAIMVAGWGGLSTLRIFPPSTVPSPLEVVAALGEEATSGRLLKDVVASLFRVQVGFLLAVVLGVPAGLLLGLHEGARVALLPIVNFFRSLSPLAWIPFAVLWFGVGDRPTIFLIFMATFFPLVLSAMAAVAGIPSVYFRVARDHGLGRWEQLLQITLPAILPQIITALRVGMGLAWLVVVAAEMLAGKEGLGFAVWDARNGLRWDLLAAEMVVIGTIGVALDRVLFQLTRIPSVRWGYER